MSFPPVPLIILRRGQQQVEILDPRADPSVLGARYVHGGYIAAWSVGGRCLTSGPGKVWNSFDGCGLPETFELPLAWGVAGEDDLYMRIGAGQLRRHGPYAGDTANRQPLETTIAWTVISQSEEHVTMRTSDRLASAASVVTYELERTVRMHDDGVESTTTLTLSCGRMTQHPIGWFAHPFFAQTTLAASAVTIPQAQLLTRPDSGQQVEPGAGSLRQAADGRWRFTGTGFHRSILTGIWGSTAAIEVDLDPALGGGQVRIGLDRPLDHAVVWGAGHVFSPEPKLCRLWQDGETASWAVRYRFAPA
jgi:hypothetical protein